MTAAMTARRLPPLNSLRAFEAAARHGSFTGAARELGVTQGAVSRHVLQLEASVGTLCARVRHGIELTAEGAAYAEALRAAFDQIEQHTRRLTSKPSANTLRLKLPPTFAIRWLVPRLARFHGVNRADRRADHDLAQGCRVRSRGHRRVHPLGARAAAGARCRPLFGEILLPVCSPALRNAVRRLKRPADLARHVLLCSLHRPDDWPIWLAAAGVAEIDGNDGLKFENSALAYQAAIDEVGIVVAQRAFVEEDLRAGRLVEVFDLRAPTANAYYLAYPAQQPVSAKVRAFEEWIVGEASRLEEAVV